MLSGETLGKPQTGNYQTVSNFPQILVFGMSVIYCDSKQGVLMCECVTGDKAWVKKWGICVKSK